MAIPVAFIAGAAITSFMTMPQEGADAAVVQSGGGLDGALWTVDEQRRCAAAVETARTDMVDLRQQLEALQSQVIAVTREKVEAEREAASALAGKAAAEAEVARVMTVSASLAFEQPDSSEPSGNVASSVASPPVQAPSLPSLGSVSGSASSSGQPITGTNVVDEPGPSSSPEVTAAVTATAPGFSAADKRPLSPRSSLAVSDAMSSAAGLDLLSEAARRDLEASLVRGECVSDSLSDAFNSQVPVVPLRDLIRKLDSEC
jgi:hypothetical protein